MGPSNQILISAGGPLTVAPSAGSERFRKTCEPALLGPSRRAASIAAAIAVGRDPELTAQVCLGSRRHQVKSSYPTTSYGRIMSLSSCSRIWQWNT